MKGLAAGNGEAEAGRRFLAHISENGDRTQTVQEHLEGTAELSAAFAAAFGMAEQGRLIGLAHDMGKCSVEFQKRLRGGRIVDHASAGALECAKLDALWAACCIAGHHGGLPDFGNMRNDTVDDPTLVGRLRKADAGKIPDYVQPFPLKAAAPPPGYGKDPLADSFIIRMLFSCLVDADFLDTEGFMVGDKTGKRAGDSPAALLEMLDRHTQKWRPPKNELNRRRCSILNACIERGKSDKGLYTLTVPTGGGKTVSSMAFALNHAVWHNMERVIYVIPYTSIIEQTADTLRDIFGAHNVVEHHSNAVLEADENGSAKQYLHIKATENWDAPIIVTTAVQFFESIYANRPSKCRKLHNMANSVIIFDEAQMLPSSQLRPCVAAIASLVEHFGSTAVMCTATQPVLNDLFRDYAPTRVTSEICPGTEELFAQFRRVAFSDAGLLDIHSLSVRLSALPQVLCIVNSRKAAQAVFKQLPPEGSFHLSTLMYPAHRRSILEEIRRRLKDGMPCRVVSTSLIEAGVDVDFPAVFRELAGLDSILQAAGRCNREGKRRAEDSIVTVFGGVSDTPPMLQANIGAAREVLGQGVDPAHPATVRRYFQAYRSLAADLDKQSVIPAFAEGVQGRLLPFRTVAEQFRLIDEATKTVFIPKGEGGGLVERWQRGERSRELFRKLGQYGVSVYERQYQALMNAGCLMPLDDESAVLSDMALYDKATGLSSSPVYGTGLFV